MDLVHASDPAPAAARPPILVLDDTVIDQIAAGEVVERPASVVKELIENALDAGARQISVEIEEGGRRLVRVVDDGWGMTPEEARLALRRHATSKLRTLADLFSLGTMGFRGEALPSIAAVSRLTLTTRVAGAPAGFRLVVEAGVLVDAVEVGAPVGTQIEVRDLLYNVPARLKFLKGDATEAGHVSEVVSRVALAYPELHVRLRSGGRSLVAAPPHRDGLERAQSVLGSRLAGRLHRGAGEEGGVRVEAFLAAPSLAQSTARGVQLFVGRRPVRDRGLLHALALGYGELVPRGRYPLAVLFVDVPSGSVDVNVHPQKLEVRFADAQRVYAAVRHVVGRAVAAAPWLDELPGPSPVRMQVIAQYSPTATAAPSPSRAGDVAASYAAERSRMLLPWSAPRWARAEAPSPSPSGAAPSNAIPRPMSPSGSAPAFLSREAAAAEPDPAAATFLASLRYLGQLDRTYLVCEGPSDLVLIDQHAAHERVAFQRLRERAGDPVPVQRMLFPLPVELPEAQAAAVIEAAGELRALGFDVEPAGAQGVLLKAAPAALRGAEPEAVLRALCNDLVDGDGARCSSDSIAERLDAMRATIACHSVVRAGDLLSHAEAEALLASLDGVDFKAHCPHGRPVLLRISVSEIARRLGR